MIMDDLAIVNERTDEHFGKCMELAEENRDLNRKIWKLQRDMETINGLVSGLVESLGRETKDRVR